MIELRDTIDDQTANEKKISMAKKVDKGDRISCKQLKNRRRIFISQDFALNLIKRIHKFYGHIGSAQLIQKLRPHYYCLNLEKLVDEFYEPCEICIKIKQDVAGQ